MTSDTTTSSGLSLRTLLIAVGITAVLTGTIAWLVWGRGAPPREEAQKEHADDLPPGVVEVPTAAQKSSGMATTTVAMRRLPTTIEVTGKVTADEARSAHVRPLGRGVIEKVWVRLGERVKKGQPLATYDNIALGELVGEYLSARAVLRQADADRDVKRRMVERGRELVKSEAIARQTLDLREAELKNAEAAIARDQSTVSRFEEQIHRFGLSDDDLTKLLPGDGESPHRSASHAILRAPFDGVVTKYDVAQGEIVETDRELFTVTDLSVVWVLADVYEKNLTDVKTGIDATVRVEAYPDRTFSGRVTNVSDLIDPQTRSAKARVVVTNADAALKLDMFARIIIPTADQRDALVVPLAAVQTVENQSVVFVKNTDQRFARRNVELGATAGDVVEVRSGLTAGVTIVSAGSFYLKTALLREQIGDEH